MMTAIRTLPEELCCCLLSLHLSNWLVLEKQPRAMTNRFPHLLIKLPERVALPLPKGILISFKPGSNATHGHILL